MSEESIGQSEDMDSDLKEYLACFKSNAGRQPKPKTLAKTTSPAKEMPKNYTKAVGSSTYKKSLNSSSEADSLSEDSSLLSTASPHKKFNLKDVNDLQTSHTISEDAKQDDDDTASAIGKLVLSLKELGSTPEDMTVSISSNDMDDVTTSSFNVNANVFTVDDLIAVDDSESTAKSTADKNPVTDNVMTGYKSTGDNSEVESYKDDFEEEEEEEEDGENTIVEESFVSESVKDLVSGSTTESQPGISNGDKLTTTSISSSPDIKRDSSVSQTDETHTFQHSRTSENTNTTTENNSLSKHEVCHIDVNPCCHPALGWHPD